MLTEPFHMRQFSGASERLYSQLVPCEAGDLSSWVSCLSLFRLPEQSNSLGGLWKVEISFFQFWRPQSPRSRQGGDGVWRGLASCFTEDRLLESSHGNRTRQPTQVPFIRALFLSWELHPHGPNKSQKPSPNTITFWIRLQHINFRERQTCSPPATPREMISYIGL